MGTTSGLYVGRRRSFRYFASWNFAGPVLTWTAVVRAAENFSKLLVGQIDLDHADSDADLAVLVRREVEERIDLQTWLG
jgi:hypothetical protein